MHHVTSNGRRSSNRRRHTHDIERPDELDAIKTQRQAFAALSKLGPLIYAFRLEDGRIKIGHTTELARRIDKLYASHHVRVAEFLAYRFGTRDDEQAVHDSLKGLAVEGREFYPACPEVLAVVNGWRSALRLPDVT